MELSGALYLLHTSKLVRTPEVLLNASYDKLFYHFTCKLLADPAWAEMEEGYNSFYWSNRNISVSYILERKPTGLLPERITLFTPRHT